MAWGPCVVSGRRVARIRGRSRASMSDAIIPALKHRISNSKVKRARARVVLGWVTSLEVLVLPSLFLIFRRYDS